MIDACRPSYACALLLTTCPSLSPSPSLIRCSSHFSSPLSSTFRSSSRSFPQLSPSSSILLPSSASPPVPDLFFFCLNLVAIRSGHTPRQGRVRSPRPDLEEVQQRAARVHVRKGGGSVRARTHIRRFLPSTAPITIHRRGSLFSYSEIIAVPWILVNDRPRNFSFRPWPRRHMSPPISSDIYDCCDPAQT